MESKFSLQKWRFTESRMGGDSNPRYLLGTHAFQACALDHSATHPCTASPPLRAGGKIVRHLERSASAMCVCERFRVKCRLERFVRMAAIPAGMSALCAVTGGVAQPPAIKL